MKEKIYSLTLVDFADLFGTDIKDIPRECEDLINQGNFRYQRLSVPQRDNVILEILRKIEEGNFSIAGKQKQDKWKAGWQDILERFEEAGVLTPEYLKSLAKTEPYAVDKKYHHKSKKDHTHQHPEPAHH